MVKSGGVKGFPYVSSRPAYSFFLSLTSREERDERDVDDVECLGESAGLTAAEDSESIPLVSGPAVRRRTGFFGNADVAADIFDVARERGIDSKQSKFVALQNTRISKRLAAAD